MWRLLRVVLSETPFIIWAIKVMIKASTPMETSISTNVNADLDCRGSEVIMSGVDLAR